MKMLQTDAAVIGGGAAGLLAAAELAKSGVKTLLIEPNKLLGKKLRITGKGRCNLTNDCDIKTFLESVPRNGKFLYSAVSRFTPTDTMALFEQLGVPLKVERGNRVFPISDNAHDVANALERECRKNGVQVLRESVRKIEAENGVVSHVFTDDTEISCRAVLLCTGGASYPGTGSTGEGYKLAKALGHTISDPKSSLVPLVSMDDLCAEMQGFAPRNVTLRAYENDRLIFEELGEMLFTHFGVSGPLVLSASAHMRNLDTKIYRLSLDLKPGLSEKQLDARILRDFQKYQNRDFANALGDLEGRAMIPVLVRLSGIPAEEKVNSITKEQRKTLVALFKDFPIRIAGPRPIEEAIVTSGGVNVKEIDPKTMGSKLLSGLYFAGEVIDVDAYTGGFNLQIAWSTAHAAATAVSVSLAASKT